MSNREKAAQHLDAQRESYESCDTDGFVSQWAHGINADLHRRKAEIEEAGGMAEFTGLYEGARRVKAKIIHSQYGYAWVLHEDEKYLIQQRGKVFLPTGKRSRVLKALGLSERKEYAPAGACIDGSGTGLAGAASCYILTYRKGCKWGTDAQIKED